MSRLINVSHGLMWTYSVLLYIIATQEADQWEQIQLFVRVEISRFQAQCPNHSTSLKLAPPWTLIN